jgi:hypothetical protein
VRIRAELLSALSNRLQRFKQFNETAKVWENAVMVKIGPNRFQTAQYFKSCALGIIDGANKGVDRKCGYHEISPEKVQQ